MNEQDATSTIFPHNTLEDGTSGGEALREFHLLIEAGGPVVMILIAMSVFALAIVLMKLWQFQAAGIGEQQRGLRAIAMYRAGQTQEALLSLKGARSPLSQVVGLAIQGQFRGDLAEQKVREEVLRHGTKLLEGLRSYFRPLEVIASLAPLLGLFGTVLGMIEAFRQLEQAGNQVNPAILSGGIWAALLTTAAGLAVAIPVVAILNWLERRVERLTHAMEDAVTQIFTKDLRANLTATSARWSRDERTLDEPTDLRAVAAGE
ncbi:MotA/TolQ/ExbB proton channel family protein [Pelagibius sp. Alg239-R121]|uniref:MotA/TolQ/ExbB proton channel family protein n=1 Tax=Pelagibius sp. Alg239-R121 TaxID=2993448 RepID=UPI0024A68452|nr:MotA/TolQ/ExbB proton channel family protein [Pelagibius sp. Alg239-R121]